MKCLCLEQQLHLLAVLPSLCQKSKDWASAPASHKPALCKGLNPDPSHQIFRFWGAHEHPCPCFWLSNAPFGMLLLFWREPRCWIHPTDCLEFHETLQVFDNTHQTNKCTRNKAVSQLFHFQLPWDFSDSSDFSPSVLFISLQWNTYWQLLVG